MAGITSVGTDPSLALLNSGELVVTWGDGRVLCTDATGGLRWKFDLESEFGGSFEAAVGTEDGGCVLSGYEYTPGEQASMMALDADGVTLWHRVFSLGEASYLYGSHTTEAGSTVAVAYNETNDGSNALAVRVAANGRISERCGLGQDSAGVRRYLDARLAPATPHRRNVPYGESTFVDLVELPTTVVDVCVSDAELEFTPYGQGSPGTGAVVPQLSGRDGSSSGDLTRVLLADARGGARGLLILGFAANALPFAGGELLVDLSGPWAHTPTRLSASDRRGRDRGAAGFPGRRANCQYQKYLESPFASLRSTSDGCAVATAFGSREVLA